jgi:hypothetical protein
VAPAFRAPSFFEGGEGRRIWTTACPGPVKNTGGGALANGSLKIESAIQKGGTFSRLHPPLEGKKNKMAGQSPAIEIM